MSQEQQHFLPQDLELRLRGGPCYANKEEMKKILERSIRLAKKLGSTAERALHGVEHSEDIDELHYAFSLYCTTLATSTRSLNRLLNQFDGCSYLSGADLAEALLRSGRDPETADGWKEISQDIRIHKADDVVCIYMPFIPPKKHTEHSFIIDLLLRQLMREMPFPKWQKVHILFNHVFPTNVSGIPKDVDNYNYKPVIDRIARAMLFSDSAAHCSLEARAEFRDDCSAGCYILVTPDEDQLYPGLDSIFEKGA